MLIDKVCDSEHLAIEIFANMKLLTKGNKIVYKYSTSWVGASGGCFVQLNQRVLGYEVIPICSPDEFALRCIYASIAGEPEGTKVDFNDFL